MKINITIPVFIDENNIFKYNSSNEYYNDICYSYESNNIDIILKDRRDEYINNNMSLCENNCKYTNYDYKAKKVLCECFVKMKIPLISELEINKDKLLNNFKDIKNILNLDVLKCYKEVFNKEGLINNIGNYIMSTIIIITLILSILFKIKGYINLKKRINEIVIKNKQEGNNKGCRVEQEKNNKKVKNKKGKKYRQDKNKKVKNNKQDKNKKEKKNQKIKNKKGKKKKIVKNKIKNNPLKKKRNKLKIKKMFENDLKNTKIDSKSNIYMINNKYIKYNAIKIEPYINNTTSNRINYNDYELNNLSYKEALKLDKRTYFQFYFSLLKMKHILIFTFYTYTDYNSKIIKIILFLFSFALYLTINALFFTDKTLHKIYEDHGKFNFIYQIPKILYSTIITSFINIVIKFLSLTEKNILEIKNEKNNLNEKASKILKYLIIKLILFFILIFIFLILFWFYISCFCGIYKNTQIHLIKDTLISFSLSLLYPFILNLLPGIFRIPSLNSQNKECIYIFSKIIQLI